LEQEVCRLRLRFETPPPPARRTVQQGLPDPCWCLVRRSESGGRTLRRDKTVHVTRQAHSNCRPEVEAASTGLSFGIISERKIVSPLSEMECECGVLMQDVDLTTCNTTFSRNLYAGMVLPPKRRQLSTV